MPQRTFGLFHPTDPMTQLEAMGRQPILIGLSVSFNTDLAQPLRYYSVCFGATQARPTGLCLICEQILALADDPRLKSHQSRPS